MSWLRKYGIAYGAFLIGLTIGGIGGALAGQWVLYRAVMAMLSARGLIL